MATQQGEGVISVMPEIPWHPSDSFRFLLEALLSTGVFTLESHYCGKPSQCREECPSFEDV